ncbi:MAG TPA: 50S ribosomal protein L19 [Chloroflexota bacterium]|nr:50S ribosomal protein L19 [Chloroflexota bacterium]
MDLVKSIEQEYVRTGLPDFRPGDTVRVALKVVEGGRERIQQFEGVVLRRRAGLVGATFTVRRISHNVGVERTFLTNSPRIDKLDIIRHGSVRRAKLYYLRGMTGKKARIKEKRPKPVSA